MRRPTTAFSGPGPAVLPVLYSLPSGGWPRPLMLGVRREGESAQIRRHHSRGVCGHLHSLPLRNAHSACRLERPGGGATSSLGIAGWRSDLRVSSIDGFYRVGIHAKAERHNRRPLFHRHKCAAGHLTVDGISPSGDFCVGVVEPNNSIQRMRASRSHPFRFRHQRRLALTADAGRWTK